MPLSAILCLHDRHAHSRQFRRLHKSLHVFGASILRQFTWYSSRSTMHRCTVVHPFVKCMVNVRRGQRPTRSMTHLLRMTLMQFGCIDGHPLKSCTWNPCYLVPGMYMTGGLNPSTIDISALQCHPLPTGHRPCICAPYLCEHRRPST